MALAFRANGGSGLLRTHYCRNCGTPLRGSFCQTCGQKDDDYRRPLLSLTNEFVGDVFQWDSRLVRSVLPFLFFPGNLTRAYMRGRRQQYVSPLRLYLVLSIVFFIALAFSDRAIFGFTMSEGRDLVQDFPNIEEAFEAKAVPEEFRAYRREPELALFIDPDQMTSVPAIPIETVETFFEDRSENLDLLEQVRPLMLGYNLAVEDPRIFNSVLNDWVPRLMVILVPFFALIMGALFVRRRVYFVDHLVFSLHYHSFLFALLLIMLGAASLANVSISGAGVGAAFQAIMAIYLYVAMLRVYRGGIFKTAIKFVILAMVYSNVFFVSLVMITAWGLSRL